jgi:hypothetical protein
VLLHILALSFPFIFISAPCQGVTFQLVRSGKGLMWVVYQRGLDAWRRAKNITMPPNLGSAPSRVLIGYSGLSTAWIDLVRRGEGLVDDNTPARWGYALYVADTIGLCVRSAAPKSSSLPHAFFFSNLRVLFVEPNTFVTGTERTGAANPTCARFGSGIMMRGRR